MGSNSEKFTNIAFLDLETTGLTPYVCADGVVDGVLQRVLVPHHEVIEYGLVIADMQTLEIVRTFSQKALPKRPELISERAAELNGYNDAEWQAEAAPADEALARTMDAIEASVLLGGNIVFDWEFLNTALMLAGWTKQQIDEVIYYSKREVTSFSLGRLLGVGEIELGSFSSRWAEARLGMEDEPLPHRALNGAIWMYERFKRAYFKEYQDRFNYPI